MKESPTPPKVTCYAEGESGFMDWSQDARGRLLEPFLGQLAKLGLRANHVTALSLLSGLAFCPVFLWGSHPVAFGLLLLHCLLDGLDASPFAGNRFAHAFGDQRTDAFVGFLGNTGDVGREEDVVICFGQGNKRIVRF